MNIGTDQAGSHRTPNILQMTTRSKLKAKPPKQAKQPKPKSIIFGAAGVGKTWTALDFPRVYYIDTEGGANLSHYTDKLAKAEGVYFGPEDGSQDFAAVTEQVKALATEEHDYRTLVIDSLSKLFNTATLEAADKLGDKDAFGASKKEAIKKLRPLLQWIERLDMNVILICHERAEWDNGEAIGHCPDIWEKAEYDLHLVLRITKLAKSRYMTPRKSRLQEFPEGEAMTWSYDEFARRYGKDTIEAASVEAVHLIKDETLAEVERLIGLLKIDETEIGKWLKKAKCESLKDLSQEVGEKIIANLESKISKAA